MALNASDSQTLTQVCLPKAKLLYNFPFHIPAEVSNFISDLACPSLLGHQQLRLPSCSSQKPDNLEVILEHSQSHASHPA